MVTSVLGNLVARTVFLTLTTKDQVAHTHVLELFNEQNQEEMHPPLYGEDGMMSYNDWRPAIQRDNKTNIYKLTVKMTELVLSILNTSIYYHCGHLCQAQCTIKNLHKFVFQLYTYTSNTQY